MGQLNGQPQVMWPDHCVQGTTGADFCSDLNMNKVNKIFQKGTNPEVDSYSGFYDNDHKSSTGLAQYLLDNKITHVVVVGLALDYCVKATALDAHAAGFSVEVPFEATRAVNLKSGDWLIATHELTTKGIKVLTTFKKES
jgi:nicotinamidase/pyrazinamidase